MPHDTHLDSIDNFGLISGLMAQYAETGDAVAGLRWALPRVLESLSAEAGSLFLHQPEAQMLECVVCIGPVDVTGLKVPQEKGLVGRAFTEGTAELVADASKDKAHFKTSDSSSGFVTNRFHLVLKNRSSRLIVVRPISSSQLVRSWSLTISVSVDGPGIVVWYSKHRPKYGFSVLLQRSALLPCAP